MAGSMQNLCNDNSSATGVRIILLDWIWNNLPGTFAEHYQMGRVTAGMIGLGTVGTGVVKLLAQQKNISLKKIAVRDLKKAREVMPSCPVTDNVDEVIKDPEIEVLIEVMGSEQPALGYIEAAISSRKHIVTANKEVLAKHGPHLFELARKKGVAIF